MRAVRRIAEQLPLIPKDKEATQWIVDTWRAGDSPIQIEVSGGVTLETAARYAIDGVDFLSVGQLTHSAPACDLNMDLELVR